MAASRRMRRGDWRCRWIIGQVSGYGRDRRRCALAGRSGGPFHGPNTRTSSGITPIAAAIHSVAALFCAADDSGQITVYSVSQTRFWLRKAKLDHSATRVVSAVDEPLVASADGRMIFAWDAAYALELAQ